MSETISNLTSQLTSIFTSVEEVLSEWEGSGNLQFPNLMGMLASRFNWTEKQVRENDPLVRYYIRNNPDWHVSRGAKGGIMRSSLRQEKAIAKKVKDDLKAKMKADIEAKTSAPAPVQVTSSSQASDDLDDSQGYDDFEGDDSDYLDV